jgi:hypothetical protein
VSLLRIIIDPKTSRPDTWTKTDSVQQNASYALSEIEIAARRGSHNGRNKKMMCALAESAAAAAALDADHQRAQAAASHVASHVASTGGVGGFGGAAGGFGD